jgi:hypothetical protein
LKTIGLQDLRPLFKSRRGRNGPPSPHRTFCHTLGARGAVTFPWCS